jgi:rRNA maturation endonuclease Nob1
LKRRSEEIYDEERQSYENPGTLDIKNVINQKELTKCPMCNNVISEENLRFCPHCGSKIKNTKG